MSKRVQTTNLNLYAYENLRGLPTFLKDWSDNMLILDGAYVTVNGLISALDTRLTTAEGTLEDLSPESIEDYKIRLDALEKKVVINTNAIKDVNTRIGTINAQINSINVEQGVQNSRLTALEGITANHTSQINSIIGDISSVTDRVTTLENCCETVQHEISDMQSDINGFNDDLTVLATQFETVSGVVSELTDLVNSLQLDVVSQRLDTFENDLDALTASVTSLGGRMTDAENQIELNGNAINENALDIASIESEMGNTDYSEVGDTVSSAIVELADRIRNLTPQDYEVLVQAIQSAEQEIDDIQALIPDDATSSNKLITLNDVVIPSVNIASASRAGIVKVGQRLSVHSDGTLDANNQVGDSSYGLVKSVNDNTSGITIINNALTVSDPNEGSGLIGFGVDSNGNYGYKKVGADTVFPFKTSNKISDVPYKATIIGRKTTSSMYDYSPSLWYFGDDDVVIEHNGQYYIDITKVHSCEVNVDVVLQTSSRINNAKIIATVYDNDFNQISSNIENDLNNMWTNSNNSNYGHYIRNNIDYSSLSSQYPTAKYIRANLLITGHTQSRANTVAFISFS